MNKPLARRSFLKAMAASPLVAQEAAAEKAFQLTKTTIAPATPIAIAGPGAGTMKLLALIKTGTLPEWFLRRQRQNSGSWRGQLEPDVACLRSVSLSVKYRIQEDRTYARTMTNLERDFLDQFAADSFWGPPQPPQTY